MLKLCVKADTVVGDLPDSLVGGPLYDFESLDDLSEDAIQGNRYTYQTCQPDWNFRVDAAAAAAANAVKKTRNPPCVAGTFVELFLWNIC